MLQDLYTTFINLMNHWQPSPDSSFDLTSHDKRPWVFSQLPDVTYNIKAGQEKNKLFSIKDVGLEDESLAAYVFNERTKIIENGNKVLCYNLKSDPDEKKSFSVSVEQIKMIEKIKSSVV